MKLLFILILLLLPARAGVDYIDVPLRRVIDGDTIVVDLPCDDSLVCKKMSVRIYGLDTPEKRARCPREKRLAYEAKAYLEAFLLDKQIDLADCKRGGFFRLICSVEADGVDVSGHMINKGLARFYDGRGKRGGWCGR